MGTSKLIASNKKAYHDYFISDTYNAGIVLVGSEVKSVREGGVSLSDSFVQVREGEVYLKNAYIKTYEKTTNSAPPERRNRKLLLNKNEILKLIKGTEAKGFTIVPLKVVLQNNFVKVQIGLAKGKELHDKRTTLKERSVKKEILNALKQKNR